ncbi:helix-turn-helix domain-containing protein [Lacticaseibacillus zhaodongensis]|uniref:helix-turn-helix domain-containing protein n=1 Tax=Lacticaseibacillus zhaodongensis TaxID=2668065 RepID=UPI0012D2F404|nr:helix-turn-helix transcriptional regulator [Lacticaseibacillus zhaodongensis]
MAEGQFGAAFRELRRAKGFTLKEAAGDVVSPQFLSQFERGESQISYARLNDVLTNIRVSVNELAAMNAVSGLNWVDLWAGQLDAVQRGNDGSTLDSSIAPAGLRGVVGAINRLALVSPGQRRGLLNKTELAALTRVVMVQKHYGVFANLVIFYAAHALPGTTRRVAAQRLGNANVWAETRYLRSGTTVGALFALAETEIYLRNYLRAELLISNIRERLIISDVYERLALRLLDVELARVRGDEERALAIRHGILATLQLLDDPREYHRFSLHMDRVLRELTPRSK